MGKARLTVDKDFRIADIDKRLYGSFIEHLGRAVYNGIYQPGHPSADEEGFRQDVLELVRELDVPIVRYPGGNYVSSFFWEDSVGPKDQRRARLDLAWRTLEPNTFGIDEFQSWCKKANTEPMMAVNLGTRGVADAVNLLEYCNIDASVGSHYAKMRAENGHVEPYGIRTWCMGNEMDGPWQVGQMRPYEYGRLAAETAKAMKMVEPDIECVLCGSSDFKLPSFPEWERISLDEAYEQVDYVSLHLYFKNLEHDVENFLAKPLNLEWFIHTVECVIDYIKAKKRSNHVVNLSFDEYNVWYHSKKADYEYMAREPWGQHPHIIEDTYTFEDALLVGLCLITFLRHADRIRIACLAQLVNVIAPIMTEDDGPAWRQTIFYPFWQLSKYGRGTALSCPLTSTKHDTLEFTDVSDLDATAVYDEENGRVAIFAVGRKQGEPIDLTVDLRSFGDVEIVEATEMAGHDVDQVHGPEADDIVVPRPMRSAQVDGGVLTARVAPISWNCIVLKVQ